MRLAAYAAERSNVVRALLQRLATLPEAIEIARVTGLTLGQVRLSVDTMQTWPPGCSTAERIQPYDLAPPGAWYWHEEILWCTQSFLAPF